MLRIDTTKKQNCAWAALLAVSLLSAPPAVLARDDAVFGLSIGAFFTDRDTITRIDASNGDRGTEVDLEDDLGLENSDTVFRVDGFWRFANRHQINFSAFDLSRSSSARIDEEITWEDTTYTVNTLINADFDLEVYKLAYTWSFLKGESSYLGLTGGLFVADIGLNLSASGFGNQDVGDLTAPLPVIGLRGKYGFAKRWSLRGSAEIFSLDYQDYDGSLVDLFVGVDFELSKHTALGLGFNSVRIDLGLDDDDLSGDIDWRYSGALLYLTFEF